MFRETYSKTAMARTDSVSHTVAVFRIERNRDYTVMPNHRLWDAGLFLTSEVMMYAKHSSNTCGNVHGMCQIPIDNFSATHTTQGVVEQPAQDPN